MVAHFIYETFFALFGSFGPTKSVLRLSINAIFQKLIFLLSGHENGEDIRGKKLTFEPLL